MSRETNLTNPRSSEHKTAVTKQAWTAPEIAWIGKVADVVRAGGGKGSLPVDGDGRKPGGAG
jgi:hypothetical protein